MIRYAHTNLIARDWRRLAAFYVDVLGCERLEPERDLSAEWLARGTGVVAARLRGIHLRLPGHGKKGPTLEIFSYDHALPEPATAAQRHGYGHLVFEVDDVAAVADAIVAAGGRYAGEIVSADIARAGTITFVYLADPEDNLIEIQSWRR